MLCFEKNKTISLSFTWNVSTKIPPKMRQNESGCEFAERIIKMKIWSICLCGPSWRNEQTEKQKFIMLFFLRCQSSWARISCVFLCATWITRSGDGMHELFLFVFIRIFPLLMRLLLLLLLPPSLLFDVTFFLFFLAHSEWKCTGHSFIGHSQKP